MNVLAFDTSNYTTSVAAFDGVEGHNVSRLLDVAPGELGLRQSDALFAHVKRLPELTDRLFSTFGGTKIDAIGVSTRPRAVEGSYMPCFLAGESQARVLSATLHVPLYSFSHQQGHIAAALWSSGHMELMDRPHLAWHLSGGTTELLYVTPEGVGVHAEKVGGTTDISAGQLIDRTGQLLGLAFPAGKALDALSEAAADMSRFRVKVRGMDFSLSGVQNKVQAYHAAQGEAAETAAYALRCLIGAIGGGDGKRPGPLSGLFGRICRRRGLQPAVAAGVRRDTGCFLRAPLFHGQCAGDGCAGLEGAECRPFMKFHRSMSI